MLGRKMLWEREEGDFESKHQACSLSTQESLSPQNIPKMQCRNKEKSELCRKFLEQGYCPYQRKCKFAHGSHELKKNNTVNSKYKTKECGAFFIDGCCRFGERCNFLHIRKEDHQDRYNWSSLFPQYRQIFMKQTGESKIAKGFQ